MRDTIVAWVAALLTLQVVGCGDVTTREPEVRLCNQLRESSSIDCETPVTLTCEGVEMGPVAAGQCTQCEALPAGTIVCTARSHENQPGIAWTFDTAFEADRTYLLNVALTTQMPMSYLHAHELDCEVDVTDAEQHLDEVGSEGAVFSSTAEAAPDE